MPVGFSAASSAASKRCVEVKRRRRRKGKCSEGFFQELPGRTRFITWRDVDCADLVGKLATRDVLTDELIKELEGRIGL